jgi:glyoxylate/hydroxypyruvate reductase A
MEPQVLRSSLKTLDAELKIEIGPENVKNQDEVEFAVVWNHPEGLLLNYPNLKAILSCGHGADSLLSDKKLPEGVPIVCLRSEIVAEWMSEYLLAVVLLKRRKLMEHATNQGIIEWGIDIRVSGNQVSVLGLGFLGQAAAKVFLQMGFNVGGWSRTQKRVKGVKCYTGIEGLNEMLIKTDYLINLLPLTIQTHDLLNTETLSQLKRGAYLINVGRGETLVEEDLIPLLDDGHLSGACLDVFRTEPLAEGHPFWKHKKILITPHNSSSTPPYTVAPQILENYRRAISGHQLFNLVDLEHGY